MINSHEVTTYNEAMTVLGRGRSTIKSFITDGLLVAGGIRGTVTLKSVIAVKRMLDTGEIKRGRPRKPKGAQKNGSQKGRNKKAKR